MNIKVSSTFRTYSIEYHRIWECSRTSKHACDFLLTVPNQLKYLILPDLPILLEFTPKSILFTHQSWHITWFHNQCCRQDDLWEFWDFWKFFENFEFHKITADYWSCIPRSCSKFRTVKKYVGATFFLSTSKIKDGVKFKVAGFPINTTPTANSKQSPAINNNQLMTGDWDGTRIPEF